MTWFINYNLHSSLCVADRGLSYGDGVFETIRATSTCLFQLNDHLARLYRGLHKLGMPFSVVQKNTLQDFLHEQVMVKLDDDSVVKIIVTVAKVGEAMRHRMKVCIRLLLVCFLPLTIELSNSKG